MLDILTLNAGDSEKPGYRLFGQNSCFVYILRTAMLLYGERTGFTLSQYFRA